MERFWKIIFNNPYSAFFLLLSLMIVFAGLSYLTVSLLQTDELVIKSLSDKLSQKQIDFIVANSHKNEVFKALLGSLYVPFLALIITAIVFAGTFFSTLKISFLDVFKIVVVAEFVVLLQEIMKFLWFYFVSPPKSLIEIKNFVPLSFQNFFSFDALKPWQVSLLGISIFDILIMLILASGLKYRIKNLSFEKSFIIALSTYGIGLLLYLAIKVSIMSNF